MKSNKMMAVVPVLALTVLLGMFNMVLVSGSGNACSDQWASCYTDSQGNRFCGYPGQTSVWCGTAPVTSNYSPANCLAQGVQGAIDGSDAGPWGAAVGGFIETTNCLIPGAE